MTAEHISTIQQMAEELDVDEIAFAHLIGYFALGLGIAEARQPNGRLTVEIRGSEILGPVLGRKMLNKLAENEDVIWEILEMAREQGDHSPNRNSPKIELFLNAPKKRQIVFAQAALRQVADNL